MSGDYIKRFKLEVEIQENGIIRDPFGWIIGRCDDDWLRLVTRHVMAPNGLTVSDDGELINWRGRNYIRQQAVVRCKDCMHFKKADSGNFCAKSITTLTDPDGFCAWEERCDA